VLLYFKGLSMRTVKKFLLHKGYKVSIETIREWFHAVGRALQAIYATAIWVRVDETKRKVCLCLCIFQEEGTLGLLSWFSTTQRQRDALLTRDLGM